MHHDITIPEHEWLTLQASIKPCRIPSVLRDKLISSTIILANSSTSYPSPRKIQKDNVQKIIRWRDRADYLRRSLTHHTEEQKRREEMSRTALLDAIREDPTQLIAFLNYQFGDVSQYSDLSDPVDLFEHHIAKTMILTEGVIALLSRPQSAGQFRRKQLWFIWVAHVFSLLRQHQIPVQHPSRKQLLPGAIAFIARLQQKLPLEHRLRNTPDSLKKGAVIAYKMRKGNPVSAINLIQLRWSTGDFWNDFRDHTESGQEARRFLRRFDRLLP